MFAPATQTANAQSVTFGSIFQSFLGEYKLLEFLAAKVQCSNLKVPNWWFGCIWLHFSVLIVAIN
jgi:hypothetical protein